MYVCPLNQNSSVKLVKNLTIALTINILSAPDTTSVKLTKLNSGKWLKLPIFLFDRERDKEEGEGGVILAVAKPLNPKEPKTLNYSEETVFNSIWIEWITTNTLATMNNHMMHISYNLHNHYYWQLFEELSTSIDYAITEIKPLFNASL